MTNKILLANEHLQVLMPTMTSEMNSWFPSSSFRLLKYTKDRTPAVTAATGVLVTNK